MSRYDDIIDLPHHSSTKHPRMSLENRAAQFAPFAALTGHGDAIAETSRITSSRKELSPDEQINLSRRLTFALEHGSEQPVLNVTYFIQDPLKTGGSYVSRNVTIKKVDEYERRLITTEGSGIDIDDIISIEGDIFRDYEP